MDDASELRGLYDPRDERDACGVGFVAHAKGTASREIVDNALRLLDGLSHRGAVGCDPHTGDGAGILLQIPHAFLKRECNAAGFALPAAGAYAVGMLFMPREPGERRACELIIETVIAEEGRSILGWRDVPVDPTAIGDMARQTAPTVRQVFIPRGTTGDDAFERKLCVL